MRGTTQEIREQPCQPASLHSGPPHHDVRVLLPDGSAQYSMAKELEIDRDGLLHAPTRPGWRRSRLRPDQAEDRGGPGLAMAVRITSKPLCQGGRFHMCGDKAEAAIAAIRARRDFASAHRRRIGAHRSVGIIRFTSRPASTRRSSMSPALWVKPCPARRDPPPARTSAQVQHHFVRIGWCGFTVCTTVRRIATDLIRATVTHPPA